MHWLRHPALWGTAALLLTSACAQSGSEEDPPTDTWTVVSPGGDLRFMVRHFEDDGLRYRVDIGDETQVVDWSDLGLTVSRGLSFDGPEPVVADFGSTVVVVGAEQGAFSDRYEMITGKQRSNAVSGNTLTLAMDDQETEQRLELHVRVQDGGFGFRYVLPGLDPLHSELTAEQTTFAVGEGGRFWGQPYDVADQWRPAYETPFEDDLPIGEAVGERGTGWGFPSLFETDDGAWLLLHEAGLNASFHGSHLDPEAPGGVYSVAFPLAESAHGYGKNIPASTRPWVMPWRVGIVGRDLGDIVESNMVFDFAEPTAIEDTSWVRPGLSTWSWLTDHESSRDLAKLKNFIDLSAELGWPYNLVDANWNTISDTSMEELAAYANEKGVGLFFWYNSGGRHNTVPEGPRNIMSDPENRRAEFAKLKRLGIKGVKVDFFQSDKQDMISHYLAILEDAAEHEIMVNFHGSTIPRGWERTWPNLMTMEAVRGGEVYSFPSEPDYGALAPWHNTILPFTRNVVGSMDYTPTIYSPQLIPRRTTHGHETALAVLFESGIQHVADSAASLRDLPQAYKDFFRELPAAWDETRFLAGYPGDYVVLARRSGERWYVAGIQGEGESRRLDLDLSFIEGAAEALSLHDDDTGRGWASSKMRTEDMSSVAIELAPYGGFVLVF